MANGRHIHRRRRSAVVLVVLAALLGVGLLSAGAAYAAMRYEHSHADRIMPGVSIEGVDVSGMTQAQAIEAVRAAAHAELSKPVTVTVGHDHWTVSPATLGQRATVTAAVRRAMKAGRDLGTLDRAWHRLRGESLGVEHPARRHVGGPRRRRFRQHDREANVRRAGGRLDRYHRHPRTTSRWSTPSPARSSMSRRPRSAIQAALAQDAPTWPLHTRAGAAEGHRRLPRPHDRRPARPEPAVPLRRVPGRALAGRSRPRSPGSPPRPACGRSTTRQVDPTWYNPALNGWGAGRAGRDPRRPRQPDGPAGDLHHGARADPHPRHDRRGLDRAVRIARLHPDAQRRGRCSSIRRSRWATTSSIVGARPASATYWSFPPAYEHLTAAGLLGNHIRVI